MPTYDEYNKLKKSDAIKLLLEKDNIVNALQERFEAVEKKLANLWRISNVTERLMQIERSGYQQQQCSHRECVELVGLPENLQGEELEMKVAETFKHAGVSVTVQDFHAIHYLKKNKVVIAKCLNRRDAIAILRAKKKLRELNEKDKKKLGVGGKVYVNKSLCPEYRRLQGICNALHKKKKIVSFFMINGTIKITKTADGKKFVIGHLKNLIDLVGHAENEAVLLEQLAEWALPHHFKPPSNPIIIIETIFKMLIKSHLINCSRRIGPKLLKYQQNRFESLLSKSYPKDVSASGFDNYDQVYKNFEFAVPKHFNFVSDVLHEWMGKEINGLRNRSLPAFWWVNDEGKELKMSFQQIIQQSNKLSNVLVGVCGINPGDCVIVVLPTIPEWWFTNIACLQIGAILTPGTTSLTVNDIRTRLHVSKAKCVVTTEELSVLFDEASIGISTLKSKLCVNNSRKEWLSFNQLVSEASSEFQCLQTSSNDPMSWFFTSGTTGLPKMTEHTHASYGLAHRVTGKYWLDLTDKDVMWNMSDTGWAKSAYSSLFAPWWQGSCVFVYNISRFNVQKTLDVLHKYPVSVTCLPPTAYRLLVQDNVKAKPFKSLRHCVSAGEPLNPEVIAKWKSETGLTIREGYGQTEMTLSCGTFRCLEVKPGSMGKPAPDYDIQIIDDRGNVVEHMTEGEVAVKCHPKRPVGIFSRYVDDPEKTNAVFVGDFYLTGDRGYKDNDGYLWFVGRSDDVIISSGYRIGPFEVESALLEHPAVVESAVIGVPCAIRGYIVKAFVVLAEQYNGDVSTDLVQQLQTHVQKTTAPYKYPREIEFVESLPKTISGKIRRVELRARNNVDV